MSIAIQYLNDLGNATTGNPIKYKQDDKAKLIESLS